LCQTINGLNKKAVNLHATRSARLSTSTKTILTAAHWGPMLVETDGENVLSSRGALPTQHPNSLQTVVRDQVHSKTRVRWPMVRKGFASPDKPQGIRGQDEFVRVSWDEALALIHAQHKRIRDSYGPSSIFAGSYGWRSTACCTRRRRCCSAI
jgi:biotin/methionine sulfoxide reductase